MSQIGETTLDLLLTDCHAATMQRFAPYGAVRDAAIAINGGRIAWIGAAKDLSASWRKAVKKTHGLGGAWVTPGLIDCHTHLVFGGNRASEWEMRANGKSYEEIARAGGGILSTVRATREQSEDDLAESAGLRAQAMSRHGVTTIEIKSGYGLDLESELKILRAAGRVARVADVRVVRTFLGAHAVPPEFRDNRKGYVEKICDDMIPAVARLKLADAVDVFCETIAFTPSETERIFSAAKKHGLSIKVHAEQLSDQGGAGLAAKHGALSADHLEYLSGPGISAMKDAGTVAVLLPCASHFMRETRNPPIEKLRSAEVPIAVATDCNPGTSPTLSPLMALNMACSEYGLTPEEALRGMTCNAARALGLHNETGLLDHGKLADLAIWNISDPAELSYWMGGDPLRERYLEGRMIFGKPS